MVLWHELTPTGQISRGGFWLRHLAVVPLALWAAVALSDTLLAVPTAAFLLALLVSIWGRRLHDRGRSAWWLLLAAVPVLGAIVLWIECGLRRGSSSRRGQTERPRSSRDYLAV